MEQLPAVVDHVKAGLRWWERTNPVIAEQYAREVIRLLSPVAADLDRRQIRGTK
jgi:UDP-N-acetylglucosamine 2-epimerase